VFGPLRERIEAAVTKLEEQIALAGDVGSTEELTKAKEALGKAKEETKE
jgi:hypothetical protein